MATQGLITIMRNDCVLMKVVTGSDGYNAGSLAQELRRLWPCTARQAYETASRYFNSPESLVVVTDSEIICGDDDDLGQSLYRTTFQNPEFNPRWESGLCDHLEIVRV